MRLKKEHDATNAKTVGPKNKPRINIKPKKMPPKGKDEGKGKGSGKAKKKTKS